MTNDIPLIVGTGIVSLLKANATVYGLVGDRIFMQSAPAQAVFPYIRMMYLFGPFENRTKRKAFDVLFQLDSISPEQADAYTLNAAVVDAFLALDVDSRKVRVPYPEPWQDYVGATYQYPYMAKVEIQGHEYHSAGSVFRFRGSEKLS